MELEYDQIKKKHNLLITRQLKAPRDILWSFLDFKCFSFFFTWRYFQFLVKDDDRSATNGMRQ